MGTVEAPEPPSITVGIPTPSASISASVSLSVLRDGLCGGVCGQVPDDDLIPIKEGDDEMLDITSGRNNIGAIGLNQGTRTTSGFLIISEAIISNDTDVSLVLSPIVELTLLDDNGNEISILENSVELCLEVDPAAGDVSIYCN